VSVILPGKVLQAANARLEVIAVLALFVFSSAGCGQAGSSPQQVNLVLSTESGEGITVSPGASASQSSVLGTEVIRAEIFIVQRNREEVDLSGAEIFVCNAPVVDRMLEAIKQEHLEYVRKVKGEISLKTEELADASNQLAAKRQEVADDYNTRTQGAKPASTGRRMRDLESLLDTSREKSKRDQKYREDVATKVRPLEEQVREIETQLSSLRNDLSSANERLAERLWKALPEQNATKFTTNQNGKVALRYSNQTVAYAWCEEARYVPFNGTEHYRWLLKIPHDIDGSGTLMFTNKNLLHDRIVQLTTFDGTASSGNVNSL
jgi:hypothetical protein